MRIPGAQPGLSVVILAGGQSRRLGRDKAFLEIEGQPLIRRAVQRLTALSDDLIVVTNNAARYEPLDLPVRLVPDEQPGIGALMGVYSGLKAARHPYALAVACDMPFLNLDLLRYMGSLVADQDVVIPRIEDSLEPLHAVYGRTCLPGMRRWLDRGYRQVIAFFPDVRVRYVGLDEIRRFDHQQLSFVNVNTPKDWARVRELLES
jgi:molybdopterin-guanine dinucleotide biosynthesis protein A